MARGVRDRAAAGAENAGIIKGCAAVHHQRRRSPTPVRRGSPDPAAARPQVSPYVVRSSFNPGDAGALTHGCDLVVSDDIGMRQKPEVTGQIERRPDGSENFDPRNFVSVWKSPKRDDDAKRNGVHDMFGHCHVLGHRILQDVTQQKRDDRSQNCRDGDAIMDRTGQQHNYRTGND